MIWIGGVQRSDAQRLLWLGTLGGSHSGATGVSADGSVVVGWSRDENNQILGFRWTETVGVEKLGTLGGNETRAHAVSADGSVVVGWSKDDQNEWRAFRWSKTTGMEYFEGLESTWGGANDISADESVVVGKADDADARGHAFRWAIGRGVQDLGTLGGLYSEAHGVSADGLVVVGWALNAGGQTHAILWMENRGIQDLGSLGNYISIAHDVSTVGGLLVVGRAEISPQQWRAFRWTPGGGNENINDVCANLLSDGSVLLEALAISPDGRYIAGSGYNAATNRNEAFLLDTQEPSSVGTEAGQEPTLELIPNPAIQPLNR